MRKPGINLTRQRIMDFIREFYDERGYAPTVRDIQKGCELSSTAVVQHHLKNVIQRYFEVYNCRTGKILSVCPYSVKSRQERLSRY
jgi:SOS-response transcriptional repressor LexA